MTPGFIGKEKIINKYLNYLIGLLYFFIATNSIAVLGCPDGQHLENVSTGLIGFMDTVPKCVLDEPGYKPSSTEEEEAYTEGVEVGKKECKKDPKSCGIDNSEAIDTAKADAEKECKKDPESCGIDNSEAIKTAKEDAKKECKKDPESCGIDNSDAIDTAKADTKKECKKDPESCGIDIEAIKTACAKDPKVCGVACAEDPESCGVDVAAIKKECLDDPESCDIELPSFDGSVLSIPMVKSESNVFEAKLDITPSDPIQFVLTELADKNKDENAIFDEKLLDVVGYDFLCNSSSSIVSFKKTSVGSQTAEYEIVVVRKEGMLGVDHKLTVPLPFVYVISNEVETFTRSSISLMKHGDSNFESPQYKGKFASYLETTAGFLAGFTPVGPGIAGINYMDELSNPDDPKASQEFINYVENISNYDQNLIMLKGEPKKSYTHIKFNFFVTEKYTRPSISVQWMYDYMIGTGETHIAELYHKLNGSPYVLANFDGQKSQCNP